MAAESVREMYGLGGGGGTLSRGCMNGSRGRQSKGGLLTNLWISFLGHAWAPGGLFRERLLWQMGSDWLCLAFYVCSLLASLYPTPGPLIAASCCRNCLIWTVSHNSKMRSNKHVFPCGCNTRP